LKKEIKLERDSKGSGLESLEPATFWLGLPRDICKPGFDTDVSCRAVNHLHSGGFIHSERSSPAQHELASPPLRRLRRAERTVGSFVPDGAHQPIHKSSPQVPTMSQTNHPSPARCILISSADVDRTDTGEPDIPRPRSRSLSKGSVQVRGSAERSSSSSGLDRYWDEPSVDTLAATDGD
jgi:hypothetical protein